MATRSYAFSSFALMLLLASVVFLSGCIGQPSTNTTKYQYKNEIVTIEDYRVTDTSPFVGGLTTISFNLRNNGEFTLGHTKVTFDVPGFTIVDLSCEDATARQGDSCVYDSGAPLGDIEPFDMREIRLTLQAPNIDILQPHPFTAIYTVEYDYSGFKKVDLPIVDGVTRTQPIAAYSESTQTYGPISVTFQPPVGSQHVEGDKTVTEYWGTANTPFRLKMTFNQVGSASQNPEKAVLEIGRVEADLRSALQVACMGSSRLQCDFDYEMPTACGSATAGKIASTKQVRVPGDLSCTLQALDFQGPETTATLWLSYNYTYRFTKSETFTVQPLPGGGPGGYTSTTVSGGTVLSTTTTGTPATVPLP
jgi:hypothetical protein